MSAKWVRSQRWDDQHLTGVLYPVKIVLRLFSWISTSVVLLSLVACYGILASVPIGLIAKIPTVAFDGLTFLIAVGSIAVLPVWLATRIMKGAGVGVGARAVVTILGTVVLFVGAASLWYWGIWPQLRYDPLTGHGVRFFGEFIDKYQAIQFRRLPMMEMSELEFYSWWPLRVVLLLFVVNLVTATIRRIEFNFPRVGVLTVHTGIVVIALGSVYYTTHKQEGDVLLLAGSPPAQASDGAGQATPARWETGFYDNTRTALWVTSDPRLGWDPRPLGAIPRYNDYNLNAVPRADELPDWVESRPALNIPVPARETKEALIGDDITFRVVGYADYADLETQWLPAETIKDPEQRKSLPAARLRELEMVITGAMPQGQPVPQKTWRLFPDRPVERFEQDMFGVEYTVDMPQWRWEALSAQFPAGAKQVLVIENPASGFKGVFPAQTGMGEEATPIVVGDTGYTVTVRSLLPQPPMQMVTPGYEGASSSVAIVKVQGPTGADGKPVSYQRWIYSRFPEISQDILDGDPSNGGMPKRRNADPELRITYVDVSQLQAYFDERPDGTVRSLVRSPMEAPVVREGLKVGDQVQMVPMVAIKLGRRMDDAVGVEVPVVVPEEARQRERIGKHENACIAVEVNCKAGPAGVHWVPFSQYLGIGSESGPTEREIRLPDGRVIGVTFGRLRHEFWPRMAIRLQDFEMIPYEHSDTPRDYHSDIAVKEEWPGGVQEVRRTSLNNPLLVRTPYVAPEGMPLPGRVLGTLMSFVAPNQYKFSQAGWDQAGWRQSEQLVAQGQLDKPRARFTILGVGNNPGIYIIASGAVMMSIGIPWAFYLKPWLMQRQKKKIQRELAVKGGKGSGGSGGAKLNGTRVHAETEAGVKP